MTVTIEYYGFADALAKEYGVVLYIWFSDSTGNQALKLIASKSHLIPIKHTTIEILCFSATG